VQTLDIETLQDNPAQSTRMVMQQCKTKLIDADSQNWYRTIWNDTNNANGNKLRTYRQYKSQFGPELYLYSKLNRYQRRVLAMFRAGSLPLEIELGWFTRPVTPLLNRFCKMCNMGVTETECHFAFECELYEDIRSELYAKVETVSPGLSGRTHYDQLAIFMNDMFLCEQFGNFLTRIYDRRALYYRKDGL
jgi:hypothetical protein